MKDMIWKRLIMAVCIVALLMNVPSIDVLADDMVEEEIFVTEVEDPNEASETADSPVEDVMDDSDAPIAEENIGEEEAEEVVGGGPVQVGEGVTATFDADTGAVEFASQGGVLWDSWVRQFSDVVSIRPDIKSIKVVSGTVYLSGRSNYIFDGLDKLCSFDSNGFDISKVTEMRGMFRNCSNLITLDLSGFDTSNVTDMSYMFSGCTSLKNLDLNGFDTSNVTDMSHMFSDCTSLESLDLESFATANVTNMWAMFMNCSNLRELNLSGFNTSKVTNMQEMFNNCTALPRLDVSGFNTSNVTFINSMFDGCGSLTNLDLSSFDTSNVWTMIKMFRNCTSLTRLDLSGFNTSIVNNMNFMFSDCSSLIELDLSSFDTSNVTDMSYMFYGCSSLTNLDLSGFDMSKVEYYEYDFLNNCPNLQVLITPKKSSDYLDLPCHMYDSIGNEYTYIPVLSHSIVLARTTDLAKNLCGTIYTSGDNYSDLTNEIPLARPFEKCVFKTTSTEYNSELAYYLAALCRSAYGIVKDNKTVAEQMVNIKKSISSLGLKMIAYDYQNDYTPAYTIAKKTVANGSTLVLITIRGSYDLDWANNANIGLSGFFGLGKHQGFENSANQIYGKLKEVLGGIATSNVTYVITGHSQGGAIGNLLAVKLYDNEVPTSNVYDYNFSSPNSACLINPQDWNPRGVHDNIINIALDYDIVSFLPCNELPVFDVNPLATWGKFGRSFWYVPGNNDAYMIGHDLKEVVYLLSKQYPLSKFSDYNGIPVGHIKKVLGIHCPVDAIVYDDSGTAVAGVINNQAEYYDSEFGDVMIFIEGDEKWICLPKDKEYDVRLSATDEGEMKYEVYDVDLVKEDAAGQEIVFDNVQLASGKELYSDVDIINDVQDVSLYVLNQKENVVAEISEDGSENDTTVLIREILLKDDKIDLEIGNSIQLSADIKPRYVTNNTLEWESSNKKVVTIDSKGKATAVGEGEAVVEVFSADGGAQASLQIRCVKSISSCTLELSKTSYTYNGKARKPAVTVKDGDAALTSGTDYTVSYTNNKNAGTATVKVTGTGVYTGEKTATFKINKAAAKLAFESDSLSKTTQDGAFINTLTATTDGALTYKSSNDAVAAVDGDGLVTIKGAGTATITVSAAAGKNYKAGSASYTLNVSGISLENATVGGVSLSYGYSGKAYTPTVTVKVDGVTLTKDTDYAVKYENNMNPGTAKITVTGKGKYTGTKTKTFEIVECVSSVVSGKTYLLIPKNNSKTAVCAVGGKMVNNTKVYITDRGNSESQKFKAVKNSDGTWKFINSKCELALAVQQNSSELGAGLVLYDQTTKPAQNWKLSKKSDNSFAIINSVTGYSIAMSDKSAVKGTTLSMAETASVGLQRFYIVETSAVSAPFDGTKSIRAAKDKNFAVNIASSSKQDGANVSLYTYTNSNARKFKIIYSGGGYYRLVNVNSGLCLTIKDNSNADGANIIQSKWKGYSSQRWKITKNSDGTVTITNMLGTVLHLLGNRTVNNTNIHARKAASTTAQKWYLN